jgi:hypothetical protein
MNTEIPAFLLEMSKQIREQDNHMTAYPIYQVRCKRYLVTEEGYSESHWELHAPDSEGYPTYSSKPHYDNNAAAEDFFSENKKWCIEWLEENLLDYKRNSDSDEETFYECFDFDSYCETGDEWPDDYTVIRMQETEEVIKTCFTKSDAEWFINRKQHDYPKLYTYVASMVFCPQMIELRNWIMELSND